MAPATSPDGGGERGRPIVVYGASLRALEPFAIRVEIEPAA